MSLPFAGGSGQKGAAIGLAGTLQPRGGGAQITIPTGAPVQIGYASVQSTPQDSVAVTAIFNNQVPGERFFQASIPQDSALHDRMTMPYLNAGGFVTSFALVALIPQTVDIVARAPDGSERCRVMQSMASGQHIALLTPTALPWYRRRRRIPRLYRSRHRPLRRRLHCRRRGVSARLQHSLPGEYSLPRK